MKSYVAMVSRLVGRVVTNHRIALAGEGFQLRTVCDFHCTAPVFDQAGFLQQAGGESYTGAIGSKHRSEEIVSSAEYGGPGAVLGHQQPTGQALFKFVQALAGGSLRHLPT